VPYTSVGHIPPLGSGLKIAVQTNTREAQQKTGKATATLVKAEEECGKLHVQPGIVTYHTLPAAGGASGVLPAHTTPDARSLSQLELDRLT
jgi:hypothetical protein